MRKTKIIATLGPASSSSKTITQLINAGMNLARLNMSHLADGDEVSKLVNTIRKCSADAGKHVGILMDLCGPKIRVKRNLPNGKICIKKGSTYTLGYGNVDIPLGLDLRFNDVSEKSAVKVDDGRIEFKVLKKLNKNSLQLEACSDGEILPAKGVNFPGVDLAMPSVTDKDIRDVRLGITLEVDWFALSFVRQADDRYVIDEIFNKSGKCIRLLAKVEKPEAIENLGQVIDSFDGILVARGDLGVEMPLEQVPILQKRIITMCNEQGKPVVTATQMLESMIENPTPTRAEVGDVASAIYDGTDAIMLSGETAAGKFPVESVETMASIAFNVEKEIARTCDNFQRNVPKFKKKDIMISICHAAFEISGDIATPVIAVMTKSGITAQMVSNFRPNADIIALSPDEKLCGPLCLYWGIEPQVVKQHGSIDEMLDNAEATLVNNSLVSKGQKFVFTAGVPVGVSGSTNLLKVQLVGGKSE